MHYLLQAVAVLLVAVAYTSASGIGLGAGALLAGPAGILAPGLGGISAKGAIEGALGGQWIPDVPVAGHGIVAGVSAKGALEGALGGQWIPDVPVAAPGVVAPGALGLGLGVPGLGLGLGAHGLGLGVGVASRGAVEGALGGKWIPDTHGK